MRVRINRGALAKRLGPSGECPACRLERVALPRSVKTLLTYLDDPDIQAGYGSAGGLCLAHLQVVLGQANDDQARKLAEWRGIHGLPRSPRRTQRVHPQERSPLEKVSQSAKKAIPGYGPWPTLRANRKPNACSFSRIDTLADAGIIHCSK